MAGLGLINAGDAIIAWPVRRSDARALFAAALRAAERGDDRATRSIARQTFEAFETEFPKPRSQADAAVRFQTGWAATDGAMLGGEAVRGENGQWVYTGPVEAHGRAGVLADATVDASWGVLSAALRWQGFEDAHVSEAWGVVAAGPVDVWAGRRSLAFGTGRGGGIVLTPEHAMTGIGVRTSRAVALPGFLGAFDLHGAFLVSRLAHSGKVRRPWFSAARISLSPSTNLGIGLNRAAIFGGDGNVQPLSAKNVVLMLIGLTGQLGKDSGFENQVASVDVWLRASPGGLPLIAHAELGIDDVGVSMLETAGFIAGLTLPSVPGIRELSLGLEHVRFPASCCGHPPWYRHGDLGDGWTANGSLLAHELGGHGHEWSLHWDLITAGAELGGRFLARKRGPENLFAPDRAGSSIGASFSAAIPLRRALLFRSALRAERGTGWTAWTMDLGMQFLIGAEGGAPTVNRNARTDVREQRKGQQQ
jgi:hypothetical protein